MIDLQLSPNNCVKSSYRIPYPLCLPLEEMVDVVVKMKDIRRVGVLCWRRWWETSRAVEECWGALWSAMTKTDHHLRATAVPLILSNFRASSMMPLSVASRANNSPKSWKKSLIVIVAGSFLGVTVTDA